MQTIDRPILNTPFLVTNIIAVISTTVSTQWMTFETTRQMQPSPLVVVSQQDRQIGRLVTNTVATIFWNGRTNVFILESRRGEPDTNMIRTVPGNIKTIYP